MHHLTSIKTLCVLSASLLAVANASGQCESKAECEKSICSGSRWMIDAGGSAGNASGRRVGEPYARRSRAPGPDPGSDRRSCPCPPRRCLPRVSSPGPPGCRYTDRRRRKRAGTRRPRHGVRRDPGWPVRIPVAALAAHLIPFTPKRVARGGCGSAPFSLCARRSIRGDPFDTGFPKSPRLRRLVPRDGSSRSGRGERVRRGDATSQRAWRAKRRRDEGGVIDRGASRRRSTGDFGDCGGPRRCFAARGRSDLGEVPIEDGLSAVASGALDCLVAHGAEAIREDVEDARRRLHLPTVLDVGLDLGGDDQHFVVRHLFRRPSGCAWSSGPETLAQRSGRSAAHWAKPRWDCGGR